MQIVAKETANGQSASAKNERKLNHLADEFRIITFPSVWHAFRAEKALKSARINCKLIPVPRELSSSCQGLAAELSANDLAQALDLLDKQQILMEKRGIKISPS